MTALPPLRILYVAKHHSGGNDDEGAIAHGLKELGHQVHCLKENDGRRASRYTDYDCCLFHKWNSIQEIQAVKVPKLFWYFDLVSYDDIKLSGRNKLRTEWMSHVTPLVDMGFCTDGDWVEQDTTGKLHYLPQGADIRYAHPGNKLGHPVTPITFTGIRNGGKGRQTHVDELKSTYGDSFYHITAGVHHQPLADVIARTKIMVAPDNPVTDLYWSNRVYLTLGFCGFLLHPYCKLLATQYQDGKHLVYYNSRQDLHDKIAYYLDRDDERAEIAAAGYAHTLAQHTYTHRCRALVQTVRKGLQ